MRSGVFAVQDSCRTLGDGTKRVALMALEGIRQVRGRPWGRSPILYYQLADTVVGPRGWGPEPTTARASSQGGQARGAVGVSPANVLHTGHCTATH